MGLPWGWASTLPVQAAWIWSLVRVLDHVFHSSKLQLRPDMKEREEGGREERRKEGRKKKSKQEKTEKLLQRFTKLCKAPSSQDKCHFSMALSFFNSAWRTWPPDPSSPHSLSSLTHTPSHTWLQSWAPIWGLEKWGHFPQRSLETPFIPPGRAEKDISDLSIGAGCGEGQRQETPKRLPEGSHPLA